MLPVTTVRIVGPSMEPAMRNGDWWVVRRTSRVRVGDAIVFPHPRRPDLLVVKRIAGERPGGWWVRGDNPEVSDDSRTFGPVPRADVVGRLWFRYGPVGRRHGRI